MVTNISRQDALLLSVSQADPELVFTCFEIGASPYGTTENFHTLLDFFPKSNIFAFEINPDVCAELNRAAKPGLRYFPFALGEREEQRPIYLTNHPMCTSLLKPDEELMARYINLEAAKIKEIDTIHTVSLDYFCRENNINDVDFIKIDIQGAELEVFKGGESILKDLIFIVTEVEFLPIYIDQPLFGDVNNFLSKHGLMFHKFLKLEGRTLQPVILNGNIFHASQHMWTDAIFIKNIANASELSSSKLLKLGVLAYLYGSADVAHYFFKKHDEMYSTYISEVVEAIVRDQGSDHANALS